MKKSNQLQKLICLKTHSFKHLNAIQNTTTTIYPKRHDPSPQHLTSNIIITPQTGVEHQSKQQDHVSRSLRLYCEALEKQEECFRL